MPGSKATRWPRRCSPTASIWSAARSNITGRAASCRPAPRSPTRWSTIERDAARKTPNVRATVQELYDGLTAISQNRWPSLAFDVGAVNDLASPMFSAGFYYKTFMWPKAAWKSFYEPNIRAAAGLGVAPDQPDPDHYSSRYRALRGAGARRRRGRHRGGARRRRNRRARHPLRRAGGVRRRAALRDRREDRRRRRLDLGASRGRQARGDGQCPRAAAHHGLRLLRAEFRRPGRARQRPSCRARP